jgi:hypothetical protein
MKTDKPFQKSFASAGVLFAIIVIIMAVAGVENLSYRIGAVLAFCLLSALVSSTWGFFSKKSWSWARFVVTVICFYIFFAVMAFTKTYHAQR